MIDDNLDKMKILALEKKVEELSSKIEEYKKTMEVYGIEAVESITDVEYICKQEIKKLKQLSDAMGLGQEDAKTFDILYKNLRMVLGKEEKKSPKGKDMSADELLQLVDGGKGNVK